MDRSVCIGGTPLRVQILETSPFTAGVWSGTAPAEAAAVAELAVAELLARREEQLLLDLGDLTEVSDAVIAPMAAMVREAQRLGRTVCLVRCTEGLFRTLQAGGLTGALSHAPSLAAATRGVLGRGVEMLELHLRSMPELLSRLRHVVTVVARQAGLPELTENLVKTAVNEAAANAIVHGSPEGSRNHVRISFHLDGDALTVDVADQGPGFDPAALAQGLPPEPPLRGYGLCLIRRAMDRVEFFRDDRGMLVRMTKFVGPSAQWAP